MNPSPLRRARGFSLLELLISLAISAIVLAALFGVVQSQQNAFFEGQLQRAAQSSARSALTFVEQRLAIAGYGMDAPLAFDFRGYGLSDTGTAPRPCPTLANPCDRDRIDGNDELIFYARNPRYWVPEDRSGAVQPSGNAWRVISLSSATLTLSARAGDRFEKGRIMQVVCKDGAKYAYMTVSTTVPKLAGNNAAQPITLVASSTTNPFRRQDAVASGNTPQEACFSDGNARAFLIDRFRFHVRPVNVGGTEGVRPYLVLDTGLDANGDGFDEAEEIVVAEGIESFQVGYVMTNSNFTANLPRGTKPGTKLSPTPGTTGATTGDGLTSLSYPGTADPGEWEYQPTSWYRYAVGPTPAVASERLTDHQANIRAVRIAIVARGPQPEPAMGRQEHLLPILNQNALPAWISMNVAYNRTRVETTVAVRNTTSRGMNDF